MNNLDDLQRISGIDPAGMLKAEEEFYGQLTGAKEIIESTDLSGLSGREFKGLAILGNGRFRIFRRYHKGAGR